MENFKDKYGNGSASEIKIFSEDILNESAKMFVYLVHCPTSYVMAASSFIETLLLNITVPGMLYSISEFLTILEDKKFDDWGQEREVGSELFQELTYILRLEHQEIYRLTKTWKSNSLLKLLKSSNGTANTHNIDTEKFGKKKMHLILLTM